MARKPISRSKIFKVGSKALVILVEEQNKAEYTYNDVFNLLGVKMNIRKNELGKERKT